MPGGNKEGGGLKSSPVYKMKGFSGFKSPVKFKPKGEGILPEKGVSTKKRAKLGRASKILNRVDMTLNDNLNKAVRGEGPGSPKTLARKEFLRKNTVKSKVPKKLWRPLGPGTRPFAKNVTKVLKPLTKKIPYIGAAITAYPYVKKAMKEVIPGLKKRAKRELEGGSMYTSSKI